MVPGLFHAADSGLIELLVVTERAGAARASGAGSCETALRAVRGGRLRRGVGEHRRRERGRPEALLDAGLTEASVLLEKHFETLSERRESL